MKDYQKKAIRDHLDNWDIAYIFATFMIVLVGSIYLYQTNKSKDIATWPTTTGVITESEVIERVIMSDTEAGTWVTVVLKVRFEAEGKHHESNFTTSFSRQTVVDYEELFAVDNEVSLKYRPSDPKQISINPPLPR